MQEISCFFLKLRAKNQEQRTKNKEQRTKTKDIRQKIKDKRVKFEFEETFQMEYSTSRIYGIFQTISSNPDKNRKIEPPFYLKTEKLFVKLALCFNF